MHHKVGTLGRKKKAAEVQRVEVKVKINWVQNSLKGTKQLWTSLRKRRLLCFTAPKRKICQYSACKRASSSPEFDFQMSYKGWGEARHRLSRHAQVGGGSSRGVLARGERGEVDDRAQVLRQPQVEELDQVSMVALRMGVSGLMISKRNQSHQKFRRYVYKRRDYLLW